MLRIQVTWYGINGYQEERVNAHLLQFKFSICIEYLKFRVDDQTPV